MLMVWYAKKPGNLPFAQICTNVFPMRQCAFDMRIVLKPSLGARGPENLVMTEIAIDGA